VFYFWGQRLFTSLHTTPMVRSFVRKKTKEISAFSQSPFAIDIIILANDFLLITFDL